MVVWVFVGGGEAEARGLLPFLQAKFSNCTFERKFPAGLKQNPKKPRKPNQEEWEQKQKENARGATGRGLVEQIKKRLQDSIAHGETCDLILVFDDLDCRDANKQHEQFHQTIVETLRGHQIDTFIAFAVPELEAWIIADWDNIMSQHVKFRSGYFAVKSKLKKKGVSFEQPEEFSEYDNERDCCKVKLSTIIQNAIFCEIKQYYSKGTDTPDLIQRISTSNVSQRCPHFRQFYQKLSDFCNNIA
jgi:Domain of unknown function (DUF4276)